MVSGFDHSRLRPWIAAAALLAAYAAPSPGAPPANDYPTVARVQYVEACMLAHHGTTADLYKCSCAIDHIAARLTYDQFVEASTYANYATLGGENGGIFRDHPTAQSSAKLYRTVEAGAYRACGLPPAAH
jgi:hypothetical protein